MCGVGYVLPVGWLKDLLGAKTQKSAPEIELHLQVSEPANPYLEEWEGTKKGRPANDHVSVLIRGEASYQDNLRMITGRRRAEHIAMDDLAATLIREPENPLRSGLRYRV